MSPDYTDYLHGDLPTYESGNLVLDNGERFDLNAPNPMDREADLEGGDTIGPE